MNNVSVPSSLCDLGFAPNLQIAGNGITLMTKQTVSAYPTLLSVGITNNGTGVNSAYSYIALNTMKNSTGSFVNTSASDVSQLVLSSSNTNVLLRPNLALTCMKNGTRVYQYV